MERFSRFRRYKKATAAAAAATGTLPTLGRTTSGVPAPEISTNTPSSAANPTPPIPIQRPATSAGTVTTTSSSSSSSTPTPEMPKVPSIHTESDGARPITSSSHAPSTASSFPSSSQPDLQAQSQALPATQIPMPLLQTTQQKMRGAMRTSRSPFRNLLRSSTKRPRASPTPPPSTPGLVPPSPITAINVQLQNISLPANDASPTPLKKSASSIGGASLGTPTINTTAVNGTQQEARRSAQSVASSNKPPMPSFLNTTPREMEQKFYDLVWLERSRMQSSITQPTGPWARVPGPHARALDRYGNIQPWDKNRIKLKVPAGYAGYINASPIVLTTTAPAHAARPPDRFIAMQGPRQNSVDHVWRMVYEQLRSPAVIVMLTETHEGQQEKCYPYFPRSPDEPPMQINEYDEFGDGFRATVWCDAIEETPYGDAIELRRIVMRVHRRASHPANEAGMGEGGAPLVSKPSMDDDTEMGGAPLRRTSSSTTAASIAGGVNIAPETNGGETGTAEAASTAVPHAEHIEDDIDMADYEDERIVYHFLYKRWPDFGVPLLDDVDSFLGLMRLSAERNADDNNPRIVHCSAGVGRSGTFIALEHLQRELEAGVFEDECFSAAPKQSQPQSPGPGPGEGGGGAATLEAMLYDNDIVFSTVNQLRQQRRMMVQAESQYMFIYAVLRKMWEDKYGVTLPANTNAAQEAASDNGSDTSSYVSEPAAKRLEVDPHPDRMY